MSGGSLIPDLSNYPTRAEVPNFINEGSFQTIANLLLNYPASATYRGMYARVSDLWGSVSTAMICEYDGSSYYWRPQRTDYSVVSTQTSGSMSLIPLITAPVTVMNATILGNISITPSTTNVWPGCQFQIYSPSNLGLFGVNITGLLGGLTATLLGGSSKIITYTASGWRAS